MGERVFKNRQQAGRELAHRLSRLTPVNPIILALPRGGVPIGYEIARILKAPLNTIIVRKVAMPSNPELGVGAIAEDGTQILNEQLLKSLGFSQKDLEKIIFREKKEVLRRIKLYRNNQKLPDLKDKTVILVDDGLATGVSAKAAILFLKKLNPKKIIFASPVCSYQTMRELEPSLNAIICLITPNNLLSIGDYYDDFSQLTDKQVLKLLSYYFDSYKILTKN